MYPILLTIGNVHIYSYPFFVGLGIITANIIVRNEFKKHQLNYFLIDIYTFLIIVFSAIIGSNLIYKLFFITKYIH